MGFHTGVVDRVLHLLLFIAAGVALVVVALGIVERTVERESTSIRVVHMLICVAVVVAIGIAERLYHAVT